MENCFKHSLLDVASFPLVPEKCLRLFFPAKRDKMAPFFLDSALGMNEEVRDDTINTPERMSSPTLSPYDFYASEAGTTRLSLRRFSEPVIHCQVPQPLPRDGSTRARRRSTAPLRPTSCLTHQAIDGQTLTPMAWRSENFCYQESEGEETEEGEEEQLMIRGL